MQARTIDELVQIFGSYLDHTNSYQLRDYIQYEVEKLEDRVNELRNDNYPPDSIIDVIFGYEYWDAALIKVVLGFDILNSLNEDEYSYLVEDILPILERFVNSLSFYS